MLAMEGPAHVVLVDMLPPLLMRNKDAGHGHPDAVRHRLALRLHSQLLQEAGLPAKPRKEPEPGAYPVVKALQEKGIAGLDDEGKAEAVSRDGQAGKGTGAQCIIDCQGPTAERNCRDCDEREDRS
jgi:hypothetical protein